MITTILASIVVGQASPDAEASRHAHLLKSFPSSVTWAQVKSALPKGTKFEYLGFFRSYVMGPDGSGLSSFHTQGLGSWVKFSGPVTGSAVLLSPEQARLYTRWELGAKPTAFPAFRPAGTDQVSEIWLNFKEFTRAQQGYRSRLGALTRVLGEPQSASEFTSDGEDDLGGDIEVKWPSYRWGQSVFGFEEAGLLRTFSLSFRPKVTAGKPVRATNEDFAAISRALAGKPQTRVAITSGQARMLRGSRLSRDASGQGGMKDGIVGTAGAFTIQVVLIRGKRAIELIPNFG